MHMLCNLARTVDQTVLQNKACQLAVSDNLAMSALQAVLLLSISFAIAWPTAATHTKPRA